MVAAAPLILYELAGADPELRFGPHCWKSRMALAHKGLSVHRVAWRFTDEAPVPVAGAMTVPILCDAGQAIQGSWCIALHLEQHHPRRPSLFGGPGQMSLSAFVNNWADGTLLPAVARLIMMDVYHRLAPQDQRYFRVSRELRFGTTLEDFVADRDRHAEHLRRVLSPIRETLRNDAYLAGKAPGYADYCVFGILMWAWCTCQRDLLVGDDPVYAWRERLLDAFDGMARCAVGPSSNTRDTTR